MIGRVTSPLPRWLRMPADQGFRTWGTKRGGFEQKGTDEAEEKEARKEQGSGSTGERNGRGDGVSTRLALAQIC